MTGLILIAAAAVNLSCSFGSGSSALDVTLDESRGMASYHVQSSGRTFEAPAIFSQKNVVIEGMVSTMVIDRTSLAVVRGDPSMTVTTSGQCEMVQLAERKF